MASAQESRLAAAPAPPRLAKSLFAGVGERSDEVVIRFFRVE
jgi:hypothetical protein